MLQESVEEGISDHARLFGGSFFRQRSSLFPGLVIFILLFATIRLLSVSLISRPPHDCLTTARLPYDTPVHRIYPDTPLRTRRHLTPSIFPLSLPIALARLSRLVCFPSPFALSPAHFMSIKNIGKSPTFFQTKCSFFLPSFLSYPFLFPPIHT